MRIFHKRKDGGHQSKVTGYWLIEIKSLFSIALLHFEDGSREAYHSHAFNCISWLFSGKLTEYNLDGTMNVYEPGVKPVFTYCNTFHKVVSSGDTWVLTFRGPWSKTWQEYLPDKKVYEVLTHGRVVLKRKQEVKPKRPS